MFTDGGEPESSQGAMAHDKKDECLKAMPEELQSFRFNFEMEQLVSKGAT